MSLVQALILALIQGITEFLPVSSSGHLALLGKLIGLSEPDINFDITIHLATLFAVMFYYRKDLYSLVINFFSSLKSGTGEKGWDFPNNPLRFLLFVIAASIPTGIIGLYLKDKVEGLHSNLKIVGVFFLITALFLFVASVIQKKGNSERLLAMSLFVPLLIGIAQGFAVVPGISRSGATITVALLFGVSAEDSAEFSFLISIPAILGAFLLKLGDISGSLFSLPYVAGFLTALIVGVFSIKAVEIVVKKMKLQYFSLYLIFAAVLSFLVG